MRPSSGLDSGAGHGTPEAASRGWAVQGTAALFGRLELSLAYSVAGVLIPPATRKATRRRPGRPFLDGLTVSSCWVDTRRIARRLGTSFATSRLAGRLVHRAAVSSLGGRSSRLGRTGVAPFGF